MALASFLGIDRTDLHESRGRSAPVEHASLVHMLADRLVANGWKVNVEPLVSTVRPDLVATKAGMAPHVFEVKAHSAHLGGVAQVEAYRNVLEAQSGASSQAVLVVVDDAPSQLEAAAEGAGIEIWRIPFGAPAETAASLDALINRA